MATPSPPGPKVQASPESAAELRVSLAHALRSGTAVWLRLDGASVDDAKLQSAFCRSLVRLGLGGEDPRGLPDVAVLDWSSVSSCTAEGVAMFVVLLRRITAAGMRVIVCAPGAPSVAHVINDTGVRAACASAQWIPYQCAGRATIKPLARAAIFAPGTNNTVDDFCDDLATALRQVGQARAAVRVVMSVVQEMLHNVLSHSGAGHAAAIALLFPSRRPALVQVGVADDGVGITGHVLTQPRHRWLGCFSDASVTETVLHEALSGRASESGGGMSYLVRRLLSETQSTVMIRSGAALLVLRSAAPGRYERTALTFGGGTQIRVEFRVA